MDYIKKILNTYSRLIKNFENALIEKYSLDSNPWDHAGKLFDKEGLIEKYKYYYHGAGCSLKLGNIVIDYDYAPINEYDIKFTKNAILSFINSHPEYKKMNITSTELDTCFEKLLENKYIFRLIVGDFELDIYQLKHTKNHT